MCKGGIRKLFQTGGGANYRPNSVGAYIKKRVEASESIPVIQET